MEQVASFDLKYTDKTALYNAYMPYIKNGGIFVACSDEISIGSTVGLNLLLMDETDTYQMTGKVVWLTPRGAQRGKRSGIGVQFIDENSEMMMRKIETYLVGTLNSANSTDTM